MSITVNQEWKNVSAGFSAEFGTDKASDYSETYIVRGTEDDLQAMRSAWGYAPSKKEGLTKSKSSIEERLATDTWKIRVSYADNVQTSGEDSETGERGVTTAFQIGGGMQHIETSLATVGKYWDSEVYPSGGDYPGVIEPDADGNPRGLDIPAPTFRFSENHVFRRSRMTTSFQKKLAYTVRCMNMRTFRGFEPGEVLFIGATSTQNGVGGDSKFTVTFNFEVQPNQQAIKIGNITVAKKLGWDYLWKMVESRSNTQGKVFKRVVAVFVERIYNPVDFSVLGI